MSMHGVPPGFANPPRPIAPSDDAEGHHLEEKGKKPVGTLVLVFIFLAAFVLYYFVNWKLLSGVWRIG